MSEHTPGRELDALIATRVMGYRVEMKLFEHNPDCGNWHYIRSPDELATDLQSVYDGADIAIAVAERREYIELRRGTPASAPICIEERPAIFTHQWRELPRYSTDITAAWEVVRYLTQMPGFNSIDLKIEPDCVIAEAWVYSRAKTVEGDTAPHAICLAALNAVEKEEA